MTPALHGHRAAHSCSTCRFFYPHEGATGKDWRGQCRRCPPTVSETVLRFDIAEHGEPDDASIYLATRFPVVAASDWCGEYMPDDAEMRRTLIANDLSEEAPF